MVLGIDPQEHLILSVTGVVRQTDGSYTFINRFEDHRDHEGLLLPGRIITTSLGLEVSRATLSGVKLNPGFDDETFRPYRD